MTNKKVLNFCLCFIAIITVLSLLIPSTFMAYDAEQNSAITITYWVTTGIMLACLAGVIISGLINLFINNYTYAKLTEAFALIAFVMVFTNLIMFACIEDANLSYGYIIICVELFCLNFTSQIVRLFEGYKNWKNRNNALPFGGQNPYEQQGYDPNVYQNQGYEQPYQNAYNQYDYQNQGYEQNNQYDTYDNSYDTYEDENTDGELDLANNLKSDQQINVANPLEEEISDEALEQVEEDPYLEEEAYIEEQEVEEDNIPYVRLYPKDDDDIEEPIIDIKEDKEFNLPKRNYTPPRGVSLDKPKIKFKRR